MIAGDAIYTRRSSRAATRRRDRSTCTHWRRSVRELQQFARTYPRAEILPGHDPERWKTVAKRYE